VADEHYVITWLDLHTSVAPPAPTANWSHVEDERITRIRVAFDPRDGETGRLPGNAAICRCPLSGSANPKFRELGRSWGCRRACLSFGVGVVTGY